MASLLTEAKRKSHKMASLTYCESTKFRLLFGKTQIVCDFCLVALCWVILLIKYISLPNASVRESQLQSYDRKLQLDGLNFFCFPFFWLPSFLQPSLGWLSLSHALFGSRRTSFECFSWLVGGKWAKERAEKTREWASERRLPELSGLEGVTWVDC